MSELTPTRQFILDALRMDGARLQAEMDEPGWVEFAELVRLHRLGPMLHYKLARSGLAVPQEVREQLREAYRKHTVRNLNIYRELVTVTRLLDAGNIPSIALKGAFLARFAYAEPGLRPMRDLDLLLRPEQAVQAFELLKAHGYRPMFGGKPEAYFSDWLHLSPLIGPAGIGIELHHRLTAPGARTTGFEEELWARSAPRMIGGAPIRFPSPEHMLLHLCLHATLDHLLDLGPLALADVSLLVGSQAMDWESFIGMVSEGGWQRPVLPLLVLASRHLVAQVPPRVIQALGGESGNGDWLAAADYLLFSDPEEHKLLDFDVQDMLYSSKFSARLAAVVGALFPARSVISRHFPVSADSWQAFLYYPWRWFRLLTGKVPRLLKARLARAHSMRELALRRSAFSGWMNERSARGPK